MAQAQKSAFDEVEHWLNLIAQWKATHQDQAVPVKLLNLLEKALQKNLAKQHYKKIVPKNQC